MKILKHFSHGFGVSGILLAMLVGGALAALLATGVNQLLDRRRLHQERGELGQFYSFVKTLLATDASCQAVLHQLPFSPINETELKLPTGYGNKAQGPIAKGFVFTPSGLSVSELNLSDKGIPPVAFDYLGKSVTRYLARVTLRVRDQNGANFPARYFELPILVNSESHAIVACNNEFNIADACEALGYTWQPATGQCQPTNACVFAGMYTVASGGLFGGAGCRLRNPATHACSCPKGYTDSPAGTVDLAHKSGRYSYLTYSLVHQCFRCG